MRTTATTRLGRRESNILVIVAVMAMTGFVSPALAQAGSDTAPQNSMSGGDTVRSLFTEYLHYGRLGRFAVADAYAERLLAHPEFSPAKLVAAADRDKDTVNTLLTLIRNSRSDHAKQLLELIQQGEHEKRQSADRILKNIELLGGDPQQELFARKYLSESGEYAIPHMVEALLDDGHKALWPRIINALPNIGKGAVNPLVIALSMKSNDVRVHLIEALGEIGYPQAIPYLRRLVANEQTPEMSKSAATAAISRIEQITGRMFTGDAADGFYDLAQQYFNQDDAVRADPRLPKANVWYWDAGEQLLQRTEVPRRIFGQVMVMRCAEEGLRLRSDDTEIIAIWLAANIRREARLGMNVESNDAEETGEIDATRPATFPRSLYFTQAAGPRYAHLVLERAVDRGDSSVALGAIEALRATAGESSLIGSEDHKQPLVQALQFPDLVVRMRAALALGAALPKSQFAGSQLVVPVLAGALAQSGREQVLVVDPDESNHNRVAGILRGSDRDAITEANYFQAFERARAEFQALTGVFVSTDIQDPGITEALRRLRGETIFSKVPVVVLTKSRQSGLALELVGNDPYVEAVSASASEDDILAAFARVRARTGQAALGADLATSMALQAAETLRSVALDGRTVFDVGEAEPALIGALGSDNETLQTLTASVLALLRTPTAQRAIAHVAMDDSNTNSLRIAAFGFLASSAKRSGNQLEEDQVARLVELAQNEPDMVIRTAASQSLGAINLATNKASEIIRSFYGG